MDTEKTYSYDELDDYGKDHAITNYRLYMIDNHDDAENLSKAIEKFEAAANTCTSALYGTGAKLINIDCQIAERGSWYSITLKVPNDPIEWINSYEDEPVLSMMPYIDTDTFPDTYDISSICDAWNEIAATAENKANTLNDKNMELGKEADEEQTQELVAETYRTSEQIAEQIATTIKQTIAVAIENATGWIDDDDYIEEQIKVHQPKFDVYGNLIEE